MLVMLVMLLVTTKAQGASENMETMYSFAVCGTYLLYHYVFVMQHMCDYVTLEIFCVCLVAFCLCQMWEAISWNTSLWKERSCVLWDTLPSGSLLYHILYSVVFFYAMQWSATLLSSTLTYLMCRWVVSLLCFFLFWVVVVQLHVFKL